MQENNGCTQHIGFLVATAALSITCQLICIYLDEISNSSDI